MRVVRQSGTGLAGMLLALCIAPNVRAVAATGTEAFMAPAGGRLQPGSYQLASWTLNGAAVRGKAEAELVLSLDGGLTFPIRLTARFAPDGQSAQWRVPGLPTEHGRIGLRAGNDGEPEEEDLLLLSEPFAIAAARDLPREELFAIDCELRTREAIEGAPVRPVSPAVGSTDSAATFYLLEPEADRVETTPVGNTLSGAQVAIERTTPLSSPQKPFRATGSPTPAVPLRL